MPFVAGGGAPRLSGRNSQKARSKPGPNSGIFQIFQGQIQAFRLARDEERVISIAGLSSGNQARGDIHVFCLGEILAQGNLDIREKGIGR
jgi:hypothetical protein